MKTFFHEKYFSLGQIDAKLSQRSQYCVNVLGIELVLRLHCTSLIFLAKKLAKFLTRVISILK